MILPDANLLLYAVNTDSPDHAKAFKWLQELIDSEAPVAIHTSVAYAFIRLSTNRRVFARPLSVKDAFAYLNNWLGFPSVSLIDADRDDLKLAETLLEAAGTGGNLVSDAQIAAASIRLGATVHSADADFGRFANLNWRNPLDR